MSGLVTGDDPGAILLDLGRTGSYWSTSGSTAVFVSPVSSSSTPELLCSSWGCNFQYLYADLTNSVVLKEWVASQDDGMGGISG